MDIDIQKVINILRTKEYKLNQGKNTSIVNNLPTLISIKNELSE